MVKKAAIYARVSTEKQEREKTIESQLAELREVCRKDGVKIVKEYVDNGFSGATLDRPALDQLRDDVAKGIFDIVYIHSPDRLARKYVYQALVIEELKKNGVEIKFLNKTLTDSPEDQLLLGVQGLIAEYEKAKIIERTRRGRLHKARMGRIVGHPAPYGYRYIKGSNKEGCYVIDRNEAEIVKLIFDLYIKLQSIRAVVRELTRRQIKPQKSRFWRRSTIHKILSNETYVGVTYYNKSYSVESQKPKTYRRRPKTSRKLRKRSEWIPIKVPAIIDRETFKMAQEILKRNHKVRRAKSEYLLSGLVKCGDCNSTYSGEKCHNYRFYRCNNRHKTFPLPRKCKARMISANKLEMAVWKAIKKAIMNPKIIIKHIFQLSQNIQENMENWKKEQKDLLKTKETLKIKRDKLIEIYSDGIITKQQLQAKMQEYAQKEKQIEERLKKIESKIKQIELKPLLAKQIKELCETAKKRLETFSFEDKKKFLHHLIDEIILYSHQRKAIIKAHIPLNAGKITGIKSISSWNHGQYPNKWLKFELKVKV